MQVLRHTLCEAWGSYTNYPYLIEANKSTKLFRFGTARMFLLNIDHSKWPLGETQGDCCFAWFQSEKALYLSTSQCLAIISTKNHPYVHFIYKTISVVTDRADRNLI